MSNEPNIAALAALLVERAEAIHGIPEVAVGSAREMAEWLAARGVLVPGALTDAEVFDLFFRDGMRTVDTTGAAPYGGQRRALERIAKGEGPESAAEAGQLDPE